MKLRVPLSTDTNLEMTFPHFSTAPRVKPSMVKEAHCSKLLPAIKPPHCLIVFLKVSDAVINTVTKTNLERKGFISFYNL